MLLSAQREHFAAKTILIQELLRTTNFMDKDNKILTVTLLAEPT